MRKPNAIKELQEEVEGMREQLSRLEQSLIMKDPYSHCWRGGSSQDKLRDMDIGIAVYAILKHLKLCPEHVVPPSEVKLSTWRD